jgi:hypothetical protein
MTTTPETANGLRGTGLIIEDLLMKLPQPHQLRVLNEYYDLKAKVEALRQFFNTAFFEDMAVHEQDDLAEQEEAMTKYLGVLERRISKF